METELSQEKIDQWIALTNAMKASQKWSVEGKTDEEAKEANDKMVDFRKEKMSTSEGRAEAMGMLGE